MLSVFSIYIQKLADIVKNGLANIVFAIILRKRFVAMGTASGSANPSLMSVNLS
jgi:hypothetical protein